MVDRKAEEEPIAALSATTTQRDAVAVVSPGIAG